MVVSKVTDHRFYDTQETLKEHLPEGCQRGDSVFLKSHGQQDQPANDWYFLSKLQCSSKDHGIPPS